MISAQTCGVLTEYACAGMHTGASKLRDVLLPAAYATAQQAHTSKVAQMVQLGQAPNITFTCDNWSTAMMASVFACILVFSDRSCHLLEVEDGSLASHTGEYVAGTPRAPCLLQRAPAWHFLLNTKYLGMH